MSFSSLFARVGDDTKLVGPSRVKLKNKVPAVAEKTSRHSFEDVCFFPSASC